MDIVPSCECLHENIHHTPPYLAHGLCVVLCADLQSAHPVLPLFGIRGCETQTVEKRGKKHVTLAKVQPDSASIPECHHQQEWDQYQVNLMVRNECRGLMVRLTSYIKQCWQLGGTHPWACTVPRWWHWRWRCVNPRRLGRWRPQPMGASHVVSGVVTVHWQNTPAGQTHCLRQKTWNHPATIMSASLSNTSQHGITSVGLHWVKIMHLAEKS